MVEIIPRPKIYPGQHDILYRSWVPPLQMPWGRKSGGYMGGSSSSQFGFLEGGLVSIGTASSQNNSTDGGFMRWTTDGTNNGRAGFRYSSVINQVFRKFEPAMACRFRLNQTSLVRLFIGFIEGAADVTSDDPLNSLSGVGLVRRATETNWLAMYNETTGATATNFATSAALGLPNGETQIACDTDWHELQVYGFHDEGWVVVLDNREIGRFNPSDTTHPITDIPSSTQALYPHIYCEAGEAVAKTLDIDYMMVSKLR